MIDVRMIQQKDLSALKQVLETIELFPSEMLEEMTGDFFKKPETEDIWFTALEDQTPIAIGYCSLEKLTDGTYNLYAIGVRKDRQGKGIGSQMMSYLEKHLQTKSGRILIVDTSGIDEFQATRQFYQGLNYTQEAVIRDFWEEGDDKVTFWKKLK